MKFSEVPGGGRRGGPDWEAEDFVVVSFFPSKLDVCNPNSDDGCVVVDSVVGCVVVDSVAGGFY